MASTSGSFERDTNYISDRITRDARDGHPVTAGRYRLIAARACPWANRAIIVRRLLGLESAFSMGLAAPIHDERSWTFDLDPGGVDPVLGIHRLQEAYFARFPGYERGITVPAMVEIESGKMVTNDYAQLTLDFTTEWTEFHRAGAPDLYPLGLRDEIDAVNEVVFKDVNNGVYRCGFAETQQAYEGFGDTIDFDQIKHHYYAVHRNINPTGIVPVGPLEDAWSTSHDRERLGGAPFGDGNPPAAISA